MSKKRSRRSAQRRQSPPPPVSRPRAWALSPLRIVLLALALTGAGAAVVLAARPAGQSVPKAALASELAPAFDEQDAVTGKPVSSSALRGRNLLLFFSEGVMCQACFEQIKALEVRASDLEARDLVLVNITTDPPGILRQAASAYGITTPLVSDEDRDMSRAYDVLGQGMHPDTAGHTFVLVDGSGQIRWRRDYTTMYVAPDVLFEALPPIEVAG